MSLVPHGLSSKDVLLLSNSLMSCLLDLVVVCVGPDPGTSVDGFCGCLAQCLVAGFDSVLAQIPTSTGGDGASQIRASVSTSFAMGTEWDKNVVLHDLFCPT